MEKLGYVHDIEYRYVSMTSRVRYGNVHDDAGCNQFEKWYF